MLSVSRFLPKATATALTWNCERGARKAFPSEADLSRTDNEARY